MQHRINRACRHQRRNVNRRGRTLAIEQLEQRQMLSITVNTLVDENDGIGVGGISLREAVAAAPPGETIDFSVTGRINLVHGEIAINKSLTIAGPGAGALVIDASGNDPTPMVKDGNGSRVFDVDDLNFVANLNVTISGLTLTGGDLASPGRGGAIYSRENLTVANCVISGNSAGPAFGIGSGGGIATLGPLTVLNSAITGNQVSADGGGIWAVADTAITNSTLSGNRAADDGGGIYCSSAKLTITNCSLSGNRADADSNGAGNGGGVEHAGGGLFRIVGSTLSGNQASLGGGVFTFDPIALSSSTVSDNASVRPAGGGIFVLMFDENAQSNIAFSTISGNRVGNTSGYEGGGIYHSSSSNGELRLDHVIVAGNARQNGGPTDASGNVTLRFSLLGVDSDASIDDLGGNLIGTDPTPIDPKLAPLVNNGGLTFVDGSRMLTRALLRGSPAIDAGDPAALAGAGGVPANDQRGGAFGRVVDGDGMGGARIDMGAVESQPNPLAGDYNFDGLVDAADYTVWRDTLGSTTDLRANGDNTGASAGVVDQADFNVWVSHFGNTLSGAGAESAAVAVEPTAKDGIPVRAVAVALLDSDAPGKSPAESGAGGQLEVAKSNVAADESRQSALLLWLSSQPVGRREDSEIAELGQFRPSDESGSSIVESVDDAFETLPIGI